MSGCCAGSSEDVERTLHRKKESHEYAQIFDFYELATCNGCPFVGNVPGSGTNRKNNKEEMTKYEGLHRDLAANQTKTYENGVREGGNL